MEADNGAGLEKIGIELRGRDFALVHTDADGQKSEIPLHRASLIMLAGIVRQTIAFDLARDESPTMKAEGIQQTMGIPVEKLEVRTTS